MAEIRIGQGLDIHAFEPENQSASRKVVLGGVTIPYKRGLMGHSDADCLTHALIDALLGALGRADIGQRFPDTDPAWRGASSLKLLEIVWAEIKSEGWQVVNFDASIVAEMPKINPHVLEMKKNYAQILDLDPDRIGIKATTAEKLGSIGRAEGIFAQVVVLLERQA